ncbi:carotenoid oxygenase family protein [Ancylothrix sp. C2]|uniref:carotenoid oxygenase family protein n=1 Tax=Ancylothrix sp. D3o TaxID=2953691 RepID=UPI0021BB2B9E|nr:carotenoid oxygenase family protein [Ancylothrix sp. D3o]MCT7952205.1 carotenoid oxygenase family protein [Ancylothrix sp. D3o]
MELDFWPSLPTLLVGRFEQRTVQFHLIVGVLILSSILRFQVNPETKKPTLYGSIARFDHQTGILTEANLPENSYPTEPIYAADAENPEKGWILTVVFNGLENSSEV